MANNYDFMFKFIIIGDSSISDVIKVLENRVFYYDSPKGDSKTIMSLLWVFNSAPGISTSITTRLKYRFGIL